MRAALRSSLIVVTALSSFAFGTLHDIGRAAAQDEGPAGACAKGTDESHSTLARAFMSAFATADAKVFDEILSVDYKHHSDLGEDASTPEALKQRTTEWHAAFRGGPFEIEQIIAGGDTVVVRWKRTGTQVGSFDGIGPSRKETTYAGISIFRIKCNKIAESWSESDHLGRLRAAGVITDEKLAVPSTKP